MRSHACATAAGETAIVRISIGRTHCVGTAPSRTCRSRRSTYRLFDRIMVAAGACWRFSRTGFAAGALPDLRRQVRRQSTGGEVDRQNTLRRNGAQPNMPITAVDLPMVRSKTSPERGRMPFRFVAPADCAQAGRSPALAAPPSAADAAMNDRLEIKELLLGRLICDRRLRRGRVGLNQPVAGTSRTLSTAQTSVSM